MFSIDASTPMLGISRRVGLLRAGVGFDVDTVGDDAGVGDSFSIAGLGLGDGVVDSDVVPHALSINIKTHAKSKIFPLYILNISLIDSATCLIVSC